ncbi:hypothetical protein BpHYR1_040274 [Brachionus plicatilis]|uniref:Uncharacterized protein n=1 Tax=Brachionus plicatilis TaxID=10195 RepID=A0A3M7R904_BRAPC|nr:hypothetical protein BpHYR1_040274 [Brachionus plicatilis]
MYLLETWLLKIEKNLLQPKLQFKQISKPPKGIVPLGSSERRRAFFSASLLIGNLKLNKKKIKNNLSLTLRGDPKARQNGSRPSLEPALKMKNWYKFR